MLLLNALIMAMNQGYRIKFLDINKILWTVDFLPHGHEPLDLGTSQGP